MKYPKIVGIVLAKNEWGLIAVAISHALMNHVDEVYVLDYSSTDRTNLGLRHLQEYWGDRLHVVTLHNLGFIQQAATNAMIQIAGKSNPDWVYVFDADEFLIVDPSTSLKDVLSNVGQDITTFKYEIDNFISVRDFDENKLSDYKRLRYRALSLPDRTASIPELTLKGEATVFDDPMLSKVIVRFSDFLQLTAGAHAAIYYDGGAESASDSRVRGVHLPFSTRKRLENKARHGEDFVRRGVPPKHGWQQQVIYRLETENKLDWFWERHSVDDTIPGLTSGPRFLQDDGFVDAIDSTVDTLEMIFQSNDLKRVGDSEIQLSCGDETGIPISDVVKLTLSLQNQTQKLQQLIYNTIGESRLNRLLKIKKRVKRTVSQRLR